MFIELARDGALSLQDCDNFRAFSIRRQDRAAPLDQLLAMGSADGGDHFWLDAQAVLELSGRQQDQEWVSQYHAMLEAVAPYGYYDEATHRVRAHLEDHDD